MSKQDDTKQIIDAIEDRISKIEEVWAWLRTQDLTEEERGRLADKLHSTMMVLARALKTDPPPPPVIKRDKPTH